MMLSSVWKAGTMFTNPNVLGLRVGRGPTDFGYPFRASLNWILELSTRPTNNKKKSSEKTISENMTHLYYLYLYRCHNNNPQIGYMSNRQNFWNTKYVRDRLVLLEKWRNSWQPIGDDPAPIPLYLPRLFWLLLFFDGCELESKVLFNMSSSEP